MSPRILWGPRRGGSSVKVGINGMGRIGRTFWRATRYRPEIQVVAINDVAGVDSLAYLMKYDSIRGKLPERVEGGPGPAGAAVVVDDEPIAAYQQARPQDVPWYEHDVDVVLEATGQ